MKSINRREFLGTVGAASAFKIISSKNSFSSNEKIKVGIMGLGGRGRFLTERFVQRDDVDIVYLCDVNKRRFSYARETVAEYQDKQPKLTQDFRDMLNDPEVNVSKCHACSLACAGDNNVLPGRERCLCRKATGCKSMGRSENG